jgi:hypothetical protein
MKIKNTMRDSATFKIRRKLVILTGYHEGARSKGISRAVGI